jgi:hypothetical protein
MLKRKKNILFALVIVIFSSCGVSRHLVSIDDWEGHYDLVEFNSCCNRITDIKLDLIKKNAGSYEWKMFFTDNPSKDTLTGTAIYADKKLKFFLKDVSDGTGFFEESISKGTSAFLMEYDNYSTDKEFKYIDYYTRWNHQLKGYRQVNKFAAGVAYHFKIKDKGSQKIAIN